MYVLFFFIFHASLSLLDDVLSTKHLSHPFKPSLSHKEMHIFQHNFSASTSKLIECEFSALFFPYLLAIKYWILNCKLEQQMGLNAKRTTKSSETQAYLTQSLCLFGGNFARNKEYIFQNQKQGKKINKTYKIIGVYARLVIDLHIYAHITFCNVIRVHRHHRLHIFES